MSDVTPTPLRKALNDWWRGKIDNAEYKRRVEYLLGQFTETVSAEELNRLREIEHLAWHMMDDSAEDAQTGEVTIQPMREDYDALAKLLPEDHP